MTLAIWYVRAQMNSLATESSVSCNLVKYDTHEGAFGVIESFKQPAVKAEHKRFRLILQACADHFKQTRFATTPVPKDANCHRRK